MNKILVGNYHNSLFKQFLNIFLTLLFSFLLIVPYLAIFLLVRLFSKGTIFFSQVRVGKNEKFFLIYKFRTMKMGSEKNINYLNLNEADGPVFKIKNDPRFTNFGKLLSRTGLDELPQFINVLKGEMCLIGPRPLPVYEFEKLTKKQKIRNLIKPGITSSWVVNGSHNLSFNEWMRLDKKYVEEANLLMDVEIILKTMLIPIRTLINIVLNK